MYEDAHVRGRRRLDGFYGGGVVCGWIGQEIFVEEIGSCFGKEEIDKYCDI
jgi:hypothetical protein